MPKRFVDTELWDKEWFMNLSAKHKLLIKFIFDKCDVAGIWEANFSLATTYIGQKITDQDLKPLGKHLLKIAPGKFFVTDFISFQYGTLSEKSNPHLKVISILKKYNLYQGYLEGYLKGTSGVKEEDKEEDKEKEVDKEKEKEGDSFEFLPYPTFDDFWTEYDKKIGEKEKLKLKFDKLSQEEKEKIMLYIPEYKKSQPNKIYRKNPDTFLNNKSWNDELIILSKNGIKHPGYNTPEELAAELNKAYPNS